MAAYNYYGQNYANPYQQYPYMYQQQQIPQPQIQTQQQPTQQQVTTPSIIWIQSESEAFSFPVAPNNAVALWSTTEPVVYLKQADATGKPMLKTYDLVERVPSVSKASSSQGSNLPSYATKDELGAVVGAVKGFDEIIGTLKSDIETMKLDMYGVAGRKKYTPKKKDEEGDEA